MQTRRLTTTSENIVMVTPTNVACSVVNLAIITSTFNNGTQRTLVYFTTYMSAALADKMVQYYMRKMRNPKPDFVNYGM